MGNFGHRLLANRVSYCKIHNCDVCSVSVEVTDDRANQWGKVPALAKLLSRYEFVMWMDADAMFLNFTRSVNDVVVQMEQREATISFARNIKDCSNELFSHQSLADAVSELTPSNIHLLNNGVFFMKSGVRMDRFLHEWYDDPKMRGWYNYFLYDNGAIIDVLKRDVEEWEDDVLFWCSEMFNINIGLYKTIEDKVPMVCHLPGLPGKYKFLDRWFMRCGEDPLSNHCVSELKEYAQKDFASVMERMKRNEEKERVKREKEKKEREEREREKKEREEREREEREREEREKRDEKLQKEEGFSNLKDFFERRDKEVDWTKLSGKREKLFELREKRDLFQKKLIN